MNPFQLNNSRILITGASSGLGAAIASKTAEAGATLLLLARDEKRLKEVKASLTGQGHSVVMCDLAEDAQVANILPKAIKTFGGCTGLVHAAGLRIIEPLRFNQEKTLVDTLRVNLMSAFQLLKLCRSPGIRNKDQPFSAVFISSVAAHGRSGGLGAYAGSKGALEASIRSWAVELAGENMRVNAVAPGYVDGEMLAKHRETAPEDFFTELQRRHLLGLGQPEDVAYAVQYLLAPASRWMTGSIITIDGGYTLS